MFGDTYMFITVLNASPVVKAELGSTLIVLWMYAPHVCAFQVESKAPLEVDFYDDATGSSSVLRCWSAAPAST